MVKNSWFQYCFLLFKLLINVVFAVWLPSSIEWYLVSVIIVNLMMNICFYRDIVYQHPLIEYLALLSHIYSWFPIIQAFLQTIYSNTLLIASFSFISLAIYFKIGLDSNKSLILILIQAKYRQKIKDFSKMIEQQYDRQKRQSNSAIIVAFSVIISVYFQSQQLNSKLQYSMNFKNQLKQLIQKLERFISFRKLKRLQQLNTDKIASNINSYCNQENRSLCFSKQQRNEAAHDLCPKGSNSYSQSKDFIFSFKNRFSRFQSNQIQNVIMKYDLSDILWGFIVQSDYLSNYQSSFYARRLIYFLCYNLPDYSPIMKHRLFYCYYLDLRSLNKKRFISLFQANLCYQHLRQKVRCRKQNGQKLPMNQLNCQKNSTLDNIHSQSENHNYYNSKYIEVLKQNKIYLKIFQNLKCFEQNQQQYLKIFQNVLLNKQRIIEYYETRNLYRKVTQSYIIEYKQLKDKREMVQIFFNYISSKFLNKNPLIAFQNFSNNLQNVYAKYKNQNKIGVQKKQGTSTRKTNFLTIPESIYEKPVCVVSGIQQSGEIYTSCSSFKVLFQLNNREQVIRNRQKQKPNINNLILHLFRQQHRNIMFDIQSLFERKIDHLSENHYFMISKGLDFVYVVQIKLYFFLRYQSDLLFIVDYLKCQKIQQISIKDQKKISLFEYCSVNGINKNLKLFCDYQALEESGGVRQTRIQTDLNMKNRYNVKIENDSLQNKKQVVLAHNTSRENKYTNTSTFLKKNFVNEKLNIFRNNYNIKLTKIPELKLQQQKNNSNCQDLKSEVKSSSWQKTFQNQNESLNKQKKFQNYKKSFSLLKFLGLFRIGLTFFSMAIFPIALFALISSEERNQSQLINQMRIKTSVQQNFVINEQRWRIQAKILQIMNAQTNLLNAKQLINKKRFKEQVLYQSFILKQNIAKKYNNKQLFQSNNAYNFELLNIPPNKYSQIDSLWSFDNTQLTKSSIGQIYFFQIIEIINRTTLNQQSSALQNNYLLRFLAQYQKGFVLDLFNKIQEIQQQKFETSQADRIFSLILILVLFFALSLTLVISIFLIKIPVVNNYTHAVNISKRFRINFLNEWKQLRNCIDDLQFNSEDNIFNEVRQQLKLQEQQKQSINFTIKQKEKRGKATLFYAFHIQKSNNQQNKKYIQSKQELTITQFFIQAFVHPIARFFAVFLCVLIIFNLNSQKISKIQNFKNSIQKLSQLKQNFITITETILYYHQELTDISLEDIRQKFANKTKIIGKLDKISLLYQMFPYSEKIFKQILNDQDICRQMFDNKCKYINYNLQFPQFLQMQSRLLQFQSIVFRQFITNQSQYTQIFLNRDTSQIQAKFTQMYLYFNNFMKVTKEMINLGLDILSQKNNEEYSNIIYFLFYALVTFLIIQFLLQCKNFNMTLIIFNQEFLKIAPLKQIIREQGFDYFANHSLQAQSFKQNYQYA